MNKKLKSAREMQIELKMLRARVIKKLPGRISIEQGIFWELPA